MLEDIVQTPCHQPKQEVIVLIMNVVAIMTHPVFPLFSAEC